MGELAVLAALHYRERTGKGQYIELSQTESIMRLMSWVWPYQKITGSVAMPSGNRDISICPANTVYSADGVFVSLAAPAPGEFRGLCTAMGAPELADDLRFRDHITRLQKENADEIERRIAQWARTKTCREMSRLLKSTVLATRVYTTKDLIEDEHFRERGFITEIDDPVLGRFYI
jgi:crotonobetainyl-CoA:carnitine CoA-transferase CaiB-like acyl-CoA transferase